MKNDQILSMFLINNKKQIEIIRKQISACPRGILYEQKKNGKTYFVQGGTEKGKLYRVGITSKPEIVNALIRKYLLEMEYKVLRRRQSIVEGIVCADGASEWPTYSLEDGIILLKKRCPAITDEMIEDALRGTPASDWATEPYKKSDYKQEERRQITSKGLRVRSKSEVLIAEKLYEYKISFRYEQVMQIHNMTIVPDFTIRRADGKIFLWEHQGMTNIKSYLDWQVKKAQLYASAGYVPWDNLIVTYDNADGIIDLRIVESEIRNKLLFS